MKKVSNKFQCLKHFLSDLTLLHFIFQFVVDIESLAILTPTPNQHSTVSKWRLASTILLVTTQIALMRLMTRKLITSSMSRLHLVCTYQAQPGDPTLILFISSLKDVTAAMSISKSGDVCAASMLKQALIGNHDFELCRNSAISPIVSYPKYKDHKPPK